MTKPLSERQEKLYRFYLNAILNHQPIPPFSTITSTLFSVGERKLQKNSGETSRITRELVENGLILNEKKGFRACITILPLTDETREVISPELQSLVERATAVQHTTMTNDFHEEISAPPSKPKAVRKKPDECDDDLVDDCSIILEVENDSVPCYIKTRRTSLIDNTPQKKISYEEYCADLKSDLKRSSIAPFKMALLSFNDVAMLKKLDPLVNFPVRFFPVLQTTDIFTGFDWLDLALQRENKNARDYFRNILSGNGHLMKELNHYFQQIKSEALKSNDLHERLCHLFAEENDYYDNDSDATIQYPSY